MCRQGTDGSTCRLCPFSTTLDMRLHVVREQEARQLQRREERPSIEWLEPMALRKSTVVGIQRTDIQCALPDTVAQWMSQ